MASFRLATVCIDCAVLGPPGRALLEQSVLRQSRLVGAVPSFRPMSTAPYLPSVPAVSSLSALVAATSIAPVTGTFACPEQLPGHEAVIVLGYPSRSDVDLWYSDTGCQGVDNGYELGFQGGNESFWTMQDAVDALRVVQDVTNISPRPAEKAAHDCRKIECEQRETELARDPARRQCFPYAGRAGKND